MAESLLELEPGGWSPNGQWIPMKKYTRKILMEQLQNLLIWVVGPQEIYTWDTMAPL